MNSLRRTLLRALALLPLAASRLAGAAPIAIEVWKSPDCGCCAEWVKHLEAAGFAAKVNNTGNGGVRARLGIAPKLGSCHTAVTAGYAIEGHVPADDIKRLLAEKPAAIGLAVPGMPIGSPGMEVEGRRDPYDVLLIARDGSTRVFSSHR